MESNSSSSRGGVQFRCALEEIRRISRLSSYQLDEIVAVWGDEEEQINRQQELKRDVTKYIQSGSGSGRRRLSDNYTFTSVGLCDHVGIRKEEKIIAREQVWDAVLNEQDNQRVAQVNTGHSNDIFKYNSALLAKACQRQAKTYKSQQIAYEKAKELELEILHQQRKKKIPTLNGSKLNFSQQQIRNQHATASTASGKRKHGHRSRNHHDDGGHQTHHHSHRRRSKSCGDSTSDSNRRRRPESSSKTTSDSSSSSLAISKSSQHSPRSI